MSWCAVGVAELAKKTKDPGETWACQVPNIDGSREGGHTR